MKRLIPFLITALALSSCLKEDSECPTMYVSFAMKDQFIPGDYDSRITNEVLLYMFKDDKLVYSRTIPYAQISGRKEFPIEKTEEMAGNIKLVAWAVKAGETEIGTTESLAVHNASGHPEYTPGMLWSAPYLKHLPLTGTTGQYMPQHHERYIGTLSSPNEVTESDSHLNIVMTPAPGRIEVNVYDPDNALAELDRQGTSVGQPYVVVEGGMSTMGLGDPDLGRTGRVGSGTAAPVRANLNAATPTAANDQLVFATGLVGVLPSPDGNTPLTVGLMFLNTRIATLTISAQNTAHYETLHSGDRIVFDYILPEDIFVEPDPTAGWPSFTVNINGWVERIVNGNGTDL